MKHWIVYFIDEDSFSDYVYGVCASCAQEAIRKAKQSLIEEGMKTPKYVSMCHSWSAVEATEKRIRRHKKWESQRVM